MASSNSASEDSDSTTLAIAAAVPTTVPTASISAISATKAASALLISASDKAGMAGIDRERINSILLRDSGNSGFMKRQRKMDENSNRKIEEMKQRLQHKDDKATNGWRLRITQSTIDPLLQNYRRQRRPISTCVVIDMDGFFISCHTIADPHLAMIPACVGGITMISTSNYAARRYGVRAAMPGYLGSTLVREISEGKEFLTFVKSDFDLYKRKSTEVKSILEEYDPNLTMYSLDEAYMDIGPYLEVQLSNQEGKQFLHEDIQIHLLNKTKSNRRIHDIPPTIIHAAAKALLQSIRQRVKDATNLTCSAGLASNFLIAKISSDMNKPNGQYFVGPSEHEILEFANPLPIRKVNGIGRVMEKILRSVCGIDTVKDLFDKRAEVHFLFKPATSFFLMRASIGYAEGKRSESTEEESGDSEDALSRKGMSHERTFSPTSSWSDMCTRLEDIANSLSSDLRERNLRPRTITLKVKLANFDILTRASSQDVALFQPFNDRQSSQDLVDTVIKLLKAAKREQAKGDDTTKNKVASAFSVRLLGVRCSNFHHEKDNQSSIDQYRTSAQLDYSGTAGELLARVKPRDSLSSRHNESLAVKNPYLLIEKDLGNEPKNSNNISTCTLSTPSSVTISNSIITCPICQKRFQSDKHGNAEINAHIDKCLNATTVKKLAKEETRSADDKARKKRRRPLDFFSP